MFEKKKRVDSLEESVADLHSQIAELRQALAVMANGGGHIPVLARATEHAAAIERLHAALSAPGGSEIRAAPKPMALSVTHCAACTGYVSLWSDGGWTDNVGLLVGFEPPPAQLVGRLNSRNDINSYIGSVVRRGEYWLADSMRARKGKKSGVVCVFTPFG